jgi:hypothetical protein
MILRNVSTNVSIGFLVILICLWSSQSFSVTEDEKNNIAVYEKAADGVVNVTSTAVQMDFFFNPFPTQGAGLVRSSTQGHVLTNHHVATPKIGHPGDGSKWRETRWIGSG